MIKTTTTKNKTKNPNNYASYCSVPAVHLITTVYITAVITRALTIMYASERRGVTALFRLFYREVSCEGECECEGECVSVLRPLISDLIP